MVSDSIAGLEDNTHVNEILLAEYKIIEEPWNIFELKDGSILRAKIVITNVLKKQSGDGFKASIQSQNVLGVFSPDYLRGKPSENYTKEDLANSIDEEDVDVSKVIQQKWNEYQIDDAFSIKLKLVPIRISRTKKYDAEGMPIYLAETTALIKGSKIGKQAKK